MIAMNMEIPPGNVCVPRSVATLPDKNISGMNQGLQKQHNMRPAAPAQNRTLHSQESVLSVVQRFQAKNAKIKPLRYASIQIKPMF